MPESRVCAERLSECCPALATPERPITRDFESLQLKKKTKKKQRGRSICSHTLCQEINAVTSLLCIFIAFWCKYYTFFFPNFNPYCEAMSVEKMWRGHTEPYLCPELQPGVVHAVYMYRLPRNTLHRKENVRDLAWQCVINTEMSKIVLVNLQLLRLLGRSPDPEWFLERKQYEAMLQDECHHCTTAVWGSFSPDINTWINNSNINNWSQLWTHLRSKESCVHLVNLAEALNNQVYLFLNS